MSVPQLRLPAVREAELLNAVLEVLRESGYDRLTVDAVVARARASKATIYRRWPSKADLVVAAFAAAVAAPPVPPDTGSLRGDLAALVDGLREELDQLGDVITGLVGEIRRNQELAAAMADGYVDGRRQAATAIFGRARERGELAPDADVDLLWQIAPAMLFFQTLIAGQPVTDEVAARLVRLVASVAAMPANDAG